VNNQKLPEILQQLAQSSLLANSIVTRLSSYSNSSLSFVPADQTTALREEIVKLQNIIANQQELISVISNSDPNDFDVEFDDAEEQQFLQILNSNFNSMTLSELIFGYTKDVLKLYPRRLRYLTALALVNTCTLKNYSPLSIWQEILSKQGVL
jgi:hypothetical protein